MADEIIIVVRADVSQLQSTFKQVQVQAQKTGASINRSIGGASANFQGATTKAKGLTAQVQGQSKAFSGLGKSIASSFLPMIAAGAIISKVTGFFKDVTQAAKDFQAASASLSGITGAVGEDLEFLQDKAKAMGPEFARTGDEILEAFEKVGSARPELLKDSAALVEVTEAALLLQKTSPKKLDLETAVNAVTATMNQFNEPASRAIEIVNALAAGSQAGAAPVDQLAASLEKAGTVLDQTNASTEEGIALIETLADKQIVGAEAGNALRNVLTILNTASALPKEALDQLDKFGVNIDILTNKQLPLNERLREFSKIAGDSTALVKIFGRENQTAGSIILGNVDRFEQLTAAVTGSNVAFEQAALTQTTAAFTAAQTEAKYNAMLLAIDDGNGVISKTSLEYDKLKGTLFDTVALFNDTEASVKETGDTALQLAADLESFTGVGLGGSAQRMIDSIALGEAVIAKFVSSRLKSLELVKKSEEELGDAVDAQTQKVRESIKAVAAATDEERKRLRVVLDVERAVLDALDSEFKARTAAIKLAEEQREAEQKDFVTGIAAAQAKVIGDELAAQKKLADERAKGAKKRREAAKKLAEDLARLRIEVTLEGEAKELALLDLQLEKERERFKGHVEALALIDEGAEITRAEIKEKFAKEDETKRKEARDKVEANEQEALDNSIKAVEDSALNKRLIANETIDNAEELADREVEIEIDTLMEILEIRKAAGEDVTELELELSRKRRAIRDEEVAHEEEIRALQKAAAKDLGNTLLEIGLQAMQNRVDAQVRAIGEQATAETDAISESSQAQADAINQQLESETLTEAQREELAAKRDAILEASAKQREKIELEAAEKSKKLQIEAAERQKTIALGEILINGAVAFTKAFTVDPTGLLAIFTAAQVLAQFALVASQPIPEFAKGTKNAPGGWALVGEKGQEAVRTSQGWTMVGNDGPEIVNLPRGAEVKTASETMKMFGGSGAMAAVMSGNMDDYIYTNHVIPAVNAAIYRMEQNKQQSFADNLANSIIVQSEGGNYGLSISNNTSKARHSLQRIAASNEVIATKMGALSTNSNRQRSL